MKGKNMIKLELGVDTPSINHLRQYFKSTIKKEVEMQTINYVGSNDGSRDFKRDLYPPIINYWFNDPVEIKVDLLDREEPNHPKRKLSSLEWITVHDTAGTLASAQAIHNWVHNPMNNITSWHYTVGSDGMFQTLEHDEVGWHAGDGYRPTVFIPTNITATKIRPKMEISADGYFMILGEKTVVKAPLNEDRLTTTKDICEAGIWPVIIDGKYFIPETRYTTGYGGAVVINGGNTNSIGIEVSVFNKDDLWVNNQRTAKLVAELLVKYDLGFDRVVFHNHFSRKPCPRTTMESNNWNAWLELIEFEYHIRKYYYNYIIEFETLTPEVLATTGRVIASGQRDELAKFKLKITSPKGEMLEEIFTIKIKAKKQ